MTQAHPLAAPLVDPPVFEPSVTFEGGDLLSIFAIARRPEEVVHAWRLVYESYVKRSLIDPNPVGLHTVPQALHQATVVVIGQEGGKVRSTLTMMHDGPRGLPLDQVYHQELDELRARGRNLMEVGLLADLRMQTGRSNAATFGMMFLAVHRAAQAQADIIIGVHPRHAAFYIRLWGFEIIGPVSTHPTVNHRPVVPLRIDTAAVLALESKPRLMRSCAEFPIEPEVFEARCNCQYVAPPDSPVDRFLRLRSV